MKISRNTIKKCLNSKKPYGKYMSLSRLQRRTKGPGLHPHFLAFPLSRYPLQGKGLDYSQVNSSKQDGSRQQGQGVVVFATNSFTLWPPAASLF